MPCSQKATTIREHLADLLLHAQVFFQSAYTTVFGWYATWLFLRTQSLASPVLVHAFCNWMGFPNFAAMVSGRTHGAAFEQGGGSLLRKLMSLRTWKDHA